MYVQAMLNVGYEAGQCRLAEPRNRVSRAPSDVECLRSEWDRSVHGHRSWEVRRSMCERSVWVFVSCSGMSGGRTERFRPA